MQKISLGKKFNRYPLYQFERHQPIPDVRKRAVEQVYKLFATKCSESLSVLFGVPLSFKLQSLKQAPFVQFLSWMPSPASFAQLEMYPLK
jgi:hypothetical protein